VLIDRDLAGPLLTTVESMQRRVRLSNASCLGVAGCCAVFAEILDRSGAGGLLSYLLHAAALPVYRNERNGCRICF